MKKLLLILISINFIFAYVGKISALKGEAKILRGSSIVNLTIGTKIENKDIIKTSNGSLQIIFTDRTIVTIGRNSEFKVEEYLFEDKNSKVNLKLSKGIMKTITGKISKIAPQRFKVKTKNAIIGIRGTIFIVEFKNNVTTLTMLEGITTFRDIDTNKMVEVKSGKQVILNPKTPKRIIIKNTGIIPKITATKNPKNNKFFLYNQIKAENIPPKTDKFIRVINLPKTSKITSTLNNLITTNSITNKTNEQKTDEDTSNNTENSEATDTNNNPSEIPNTEESQNNNSSDDSTNNSSDITSVTIYKNPNNYYQLGYLEVKQEPDSTWYEVSNNLTPSTNIETLVKSKIIGEYNGNVVALTNEGIAKGISKIDINFGDYYWNGDISFSTENSTLWHFGVEGKLDNTGFSGEVINTKPDSKANYIHGTIGGDFYGEDAFLMGGNGEINSINSGDASFSFSGLFTQKEAVIVYRNIYGYYQLGYLIKNEQPDSTWYKINDEITVSSNIDSLIKNNLIGEYNGNVIALTNEGISKGTSKIEINFGNYYWNGDISFSTENSTLWHFGVEGKLDNTGFSGEVIDTKSDSKAHYIHGTIGGDFYGKDAFLMAGNGEINSINSGDASFSFAGDFIQKESITKYTDPNGFYQLGYIEIEKKPDSTWYEVNDEITPNSNLDNLITNNIMGEYNGNVVAITNEGIAEGNSKIEINFGDYYWNGDISFSTENNTLWHFGIEGILDNTGFSGEVIDTKSDSDAQNISGDIGGDFYTKDALIMAGNGKIKTMNKGTSLFSFAGSFTKKEPVVETSITTYTEPNNRYTLGYISRNGTPTSTWYHTNEDLTDSNQIDSLINDDYLVAKYENGHTVAITDDGIAEGITNLNFDFGKKSWNGDFSFSTDNENSNWSFLGEGVLDNSGFSGQITSTNNDSDALNIYGNIKGSFYGEDALIVAGNSDGEIHSSNKGDAKFSFASVQNEASVTTYIEPDDYYRLGYDTLYQEPDSTWYDTDEDITDPDNINDLRNGYTTAKYEDGHTVAITDDGIAKGTTNLTFYFGDSSWEGDFSFSTDNTKWDFHADGDLDNNGFSGEISDTNNGSDALDISGNIKGKFYGDDALVVGGDSDDEIHSSNKGDAKFSFAGLQTSLEEL